MATHKVVILAILAILARVDSTYYILGDLNKCTRVPNEPPCSISFDHFVPDYASRRYQILMEIIYRKARDVSRLDSRAQCVNAYKAFLCSQFFPKCSKYQNPRYYNLEMQRWVVHDPAIRTKCLKIFASCNERVAQRFISSDYFICDYLMYTPDGWESNRCAPYDEDIRCPVKYGKVSVVLLHDLFCCITWFYRRHIAKCHSID